jgi:hypothetical protein
MAYALLISTEDVKKFTITNGSYNIINNKTKDQSND